MSTQPIGEPIVLPSGAIAPFSPAYKANDMLFLSGQVAFEEDGSLSSGEIGHQTRLCLESIENILSLEGLDRTNIVKLTIWITKTEEFGEMNKAYSKFFGDHRPARSCVRSDLVVPNVRIEIEAVAAY